MEPESRNLSIDEQLGNAVHDLAVGLGGIKERLETAADFRIGLLSAEGVEIFPEPLRELAAAIFERLRARGSFAASIQAMTEDEASRLASDIVALEDRHQVYWWERERGS